MVYRVIRGPVAVREDFLSDRVRGKRPWDDTSESTRRNEGFSVWASPEGAAAISRRFGHRLGRFVAEVQVPPGTRLEPFAAVPDHLTAHGDPDAFVGSVLRVVLVE